MTNLTLLRQQLQLDQPPYDLVADELLTLALTHRSYWLDPQASQEERQAYLERYGHDDYQFLEWLGDAVLQLIMTELLFERFPGNYQPAGWARLIGEAVSNETLNLMGQSHQLCNHLRMTYGLYPGSSGFDKVCADVVESLLGAIYYGLFPVYGWASLGLVRDWFLGVFPFLDWLGDSKLEPIPTLTDQLSQLNLPADWPIEYLEEVLGQAVTDQPYRLSEIGRAVYRLYLTQDMLAKGYSVNEAHHLRHQYLSSEILTELATKRKLCGNLLVVRSPFNPKNCHKKPLALLGAYYHYLGAKDNLTTEGSAGSTHSSNLTASQSGRSFTSNLTIAMNWFYRTFDLAEPAPKTK